MNIYQGIGFLDCVFLWISSWKWFDRRNEMTIRTRIDRATMDALREVYGVPQMAAVDGSANGLHELNASYVEAKNEPWNTSLTDEAQAGDGRAVFQSTSPFQKFVEVVPE